MADVYTFFLKNWPDCPYDKFLITNHINFKNQHFQTIIIGNDESWSKTLFKAINILERTYNCVIIALEDLPIIKKINQEQVHFVINSFFDVNGNYLNLVNRPKPMSYFNRSFGLVEKGSLYRPSCVYSLWNINILKSLIEIDENAWEFERYGAERSDIYGGFYTVYKGLFNIINTVSKDVG
ncbi:MAG: hypothetical protein LBR30_00135 [Clostridioides sp.]|jgi:hypothetical protein|nr:hypothetical protein [Clostridioides sp.]